MPYYNIFIENFIDKCNTLMFIVPSRWFSGGKGLDKFRKSMLKRTDIVSIKHFDDASKIFGNLVDIKGGVNYFIKDINYKNDYCNFNNNMTKLNKYDIFVDNKYYNLIDKIINYNSITDLYNSQDHYKIQSNDKRLIDTNKKNHVICYVSKQKGLIKYIDKKYIKNDMSKFKILTTSASYDAHSGFGNRFIAKPNEVHCKTYISFNVNSENEAKSLLSYLNCKLPNFMLSIRKMSHNLSKETCKWIPLPTLNKIWSDDEIYKYFKLTKLEIDLIKNTQLIGFIDNKK